MKNRLLSLLVAGGMLLCLPVGLSAQSCSTQYAGTTFEPKSGITADYYELEDTRFTDTSSESLTTSFTFTNSATPTSGTYSVHDNTLSLGLVTGNASLITYTLSDLITTSGQNEYIVTIEGYVSNTSGCTPTENAHRTKLILKRGNQSFEQVIENPSTGTFSFTDELEATSSKVTYTLLTDYSNDCNVVNITSISVIGCVDQKISSENGTSVCAGTDNILTARGLTATTYTWEQSVNGQAWTTIDQTTQSITVAPSEDTQYRVTANGTTLDAISIHTMVCCSQSGDRAYDFDNWAETFTFTGTRSDLSDPTEIENYQYTSSGPIREGYYALLKNAQDGGESSSWFIDLTGHTSDLTEAPDDQKGAYDGFLLINADAAYAGSIFYKKRISGICQNTMYDFSAFIGNVSVETTGAPVNVRFVVYGGDASVTETSGTIIADVASGDLAPGTKWVEKGASFNSGSYEYVYVTIQDNVGEEEYSTTGVGNDIVIDDITFSTCSPEINLYSNVELTDRNITVCSTDGNPVSLTLEAAAVYDLSNFFQQPYYLLQTSSSASGPWTNVGGASTSPQFTVSIPVSSPVIYYRVWVGASASVVEDAASGSAQSGCGTITAVSDPMSVTYFCPCADPEFSISGPNIVCVSSPEATITASEISIGDTYYWYKDGTQVATGSITSGQTEISYTDTQVATAAGTVVYTCTIFNETCSLSLNDTITVADRINMALTSSSESDSICSGESVSIYSNYTLQTGESLQWYANDVLIDGESGENLENLQPTENTVYRTSLVGGTCEGDGSITIYVSTPAAPVISIDTDNICEGSSINITDSDESAADSYQWFISTDGSSFTAISGETMKDLSSYTPAQTSYFKKISYSGACQTESNTVTVMVNEALNFSVSAYPDEICITDSSTLSVSNYPATATLSWIDNTSGEEISTTDTVVIYPEATNTYTVYVTDVCVASADITVTVKAAIDPEIGSEEYVICSGDNVTLAVQGTDVTSYSWSPSTGLDNANSQTPTASPETSTRYTATLSNGVCSDTISTYVRVNPLPYISMIQDLKTDDCSERTINITATGGTAPYQFSLDGTNYSSFSSFSDLVSGWITIFVKDSYECSGDTAYYVEPYPINPALFFSPNNDGINETWTIGNLDCYPSYIVEIFDRNGRKVYDVRKGSFSSNDNSDDFSGWDGNYNGHQLPSGDYWYLITLETVRKQYKGHFTLKR